MKLPPVRAIAILDTGIPVELRAAVEIKFEVLARDGVLVYCYYDENEDVLIEVPFERMICVLHEKQLENLRLAKIAGEDVQDFEPISKMTIEEIDLLLQGDGD
jgi:hypothetical protein